MQGLSRTQAETALSATGLESAQRKQILSALEASAATKTYTAEQMLESVATSTGSSAGAKALLLKSGIVSAKELEEGATIQVTAAKIDEAVANGALSVSDGNVIKGALGVATANAGETASFGLLTKAVWANIKAMAKWLVTTPAGWATIAIGAIVGLVSAYNNVEKKQNELIENAQTLQDEYRNSTKSISENISSLEKQKDEFERLSKGVDEYGNNISLSTDEYSRYKSIVSEILGYSPELVEGYDKEGNAIANKNSLIERSIELLKDEKKQKLKEITTDDKTGEVYDGAKAAWEQTKVYEGAHTRNEIARWFDNNAMSGGWNYEVKIAEILGIKDEWKDEGNNLQNAIINNIETVAKNIKDKEQELLSLKDENGTALFTQDEINEMQEKADEWQQAYADWQADIEDAKHGMDDQFSLYAQKSDDYDKLTDAQKAFVDKYIKATGEIVDADGRLLSESRILEKAKEYTKFVSKLATDPNYEEARKKINELFSLDKSKLSASEYEKQVDEILKVLKDKFKLSDEDIIDLKIALGFEFTTDGQTTTQKMQDDIKAKLQDEFDDKVDDMSVDELKVAAKIVADIPEGTTISWDELQEKIKAAADATAKATDITLKSVSETKKGLDSLFDSYEKDMELTADEVSSILQENPQYIQYLTKVGDKYKVNQKALEDWKKIQEEQERLVDIQMGSNAYATQYNSTLDGVSDISSSDYTGTGNWENGKQALDELIAKNKELNQSFADGKISAVEYFTSLSDSITNSGLDEALDDIGGKFDENTDYINISNLSEQFY